MPCSSPLLSPLHRIPTLWSLYRPLLKLSTRLQQPPQQATALAAHIRSLFRRGIKLHNLQRVKARLGEAYKLLHDLQLAHSGSLAHQQQLHLLSQHLHASQPPTPPLPPAAAPLTPRRTPGILYSTPYHPPLPRLKPQPEYISMLIFRRRQAIQQRWDRTEVAKVWAEDVGAEERFEKGLGVKVGGVEWGKEWRGEVGELRAKAKEEAQRNNLRISSELQTKAGEASRRRGEWARRKGQREAERG